MTMKKIFIICLLFTCGFLFAEGRKYKKEYPKDVIMLQPGSDFLDEYKIKMLPSGYLMLGEITSIIPYKNGCLFKQLNRRDGTIYEFYVENGYKFYSTEYIEYQNKRKEYSKEELAEQGLYPYILKVVDIQPNLLTVRFEIEE